jgi:hypothetical protein
MPIYHEVMLQMGPEKKKSYYVYLFEQPRSRRWIAEAYWQWAKRTFKLMEALNGPAKRWHHWRSCPNHDCQVWTIVQTGKKERMCGFLPLSARQELRHAHLLRAGRSKYRVVAREVTPAEARLLGWKSFIEELDGPTSSQA